MRAEPFRAYNFGLLIEGLEVGGFIGCSEIKAETEVIAYREGSSGSLVHHMPGRLNYAPVTLERGMTQDDQLWSWFDATLEGTPIRRNVSVVMFGPDGLSEVMRWNLFEAWPSVFRAAPLNAATSAVAVEAMTLVYDRLERS